MQINTGKKSKGDVFMPLVRVTEDYQLSIPEEIRQKFSVGDYFEVIETEAGILFRPRQAVDKMSDQEIMAYWEEKLEEPGEISLSDETRENVDAALEEYEKGEVKGPFESVEEMKKSFLTEKSL